jgi:hypothetical protein
MKSCTHPYCEQVNPQPLGAFYRQKRRNGQYTLASYCKECTKRKVNEWRWDNPEKAQALGRRQGKRWSQNNPDKLRAYNLRRFNLTIDQYDKLSELQGGVCAICQRPPRGTKYLAVDHDHACCPADESCGECIRGLLCGPCNLSLGNLEKYMHRAVEYLTTQKSDAIVGLAG